jgi:PAS domain S-box-containing protein
VDPLQLLLQKVLDAVVVMRRDGTVADWNGCAEEIFGWGRGEALGRSMNELIVPPQYQEAHAAGLKRYLQTGEGPVIDRRIEITGLNRDGEEFPIELSITEADYGGEQVFIGFLRDISDRKEAELALRESEARLAATYNHALVGIAEVDRNGRFMRSNGQFSVITGYSGEELRQRTLFEITHPADIAPDRALFEEQWSGERDSYTLEKRYIRKDGAVIWIELFASIVRGVDGDRSFGIRIVRDITDRKRTEEHQRLLTTELNHRVKNTLAVVQGLAHQTFKPGVVPDEMIRAFEGRLSALAAAHDLLMRRSWEAAPITVLLADALKPFQGAEQRFGLDGPEILLTASATVNLALGVHELATNAAKYGALSVPEGRVDIDWQAADGEFRLSWRERGGPTVAEPVKRGFGTRLLERALSRDLGGTVQVDFRAEGVTCTIHAPIARVTA